MACLVGVGGRRAGRTGFALGGIRVGLDKVEEGFT